MRLSVNERGNWIDINNYENKHSFFAYPFVY